MTDEFYSIDRVTPLSQVPRGSRVHVIGVCGVAMAQIACELVKQGYRVSGSDKEFYDPMGSLLRSSAVQLLRGYGADNVPADCGLVVIGNAVGREHVEVVRTKELGLRYSIFPKLLYDLCIAGRHSIVVAGTHGKTTTSACGAFLLERLGLHPSYFVGGETLDLDQSLVSGSGSWSVVEGDEYDSAFFAKVPKFFFYGAHTALVTSIEFDHADIYSSIEDIDKAFDSLVVKLGEHGRLIACVDDAGVRRLLSRWNGKGPRIWRYGTAQDAEVRLERCEQGQGVQHLTVSAPGSGSSRDAVSASLQLPGLHNARNAVGVLAALHSCGISLAKAAAPLAEFRGVRRRQEVRFDGAVTLIEDFAHHPTAVRETVAAIRTRYPDRRLWAVFEPRSNTSRRRVFQKDYEEAFDLAARVLLCGVTAREKDVSSDLLSVDELAEGIKKRGVSCEAVASPESIHALLMRQVEAGDVVLLMSNGAFGGLPAILTKDFERNWPRS